jgi:hypothetical protein
VDSDRGSSRGESTLVLAGLAPGNENDYGSGFSLAEDGLKLVYERRARHVDLEIAALDGSARRTLASTSGRIVGGRLSPDGRSLVYAVRDGARGSSPSTSRRAGAASSGRAARSSPAVRAGHRTDGTSPLACSVGRTARCAWSARQAACPASFPRARMGWHPPLWPPDGRIAYQSPDIRSFRVLDPLTEEDGIPLEPGDAFVLAVAVSRDGRDLAVLLNHEEDRRGVHRLWRLSLGDGSRQLLAEGSYGPIAWSQDGQWVYLVQSDAVQGRRLHRVHRDGGEPVALRTLSPHDPNLEVFLSHDERSLTYTLTEERSDIWIVEDFDPDR